MKTLLSLVAILFACALPAAAQSESAPPVTPTAAPTNANSVSLTAGYDFTTGKYGTTDTTRDNTWSLAAKDTYGAWSAELTVPFLLVRAPADVTLVDGKPSVTAGDVVNKKVASIAAQYGLTQAQLVQGILKQNNLTLADYRKLKPAQRAQLMTDYLQGLSGASANVSDTSTVSGVGDVDLTLSVELYNSKATGWDVALSGDVTFGTANVDKGLGTGKNSYSPSLDIAKTLGRFTPEVTIGHEFVGKPADSDLQDFWYGSAGCSFALTNRIAMSATYSYCGSSNEGGDSDQEIGVGYRQQIGKSASLEFHALAGLTNAAPDFGAGGSVLISF